MSYLLDTSVVSEPMQARPAAEVIAWMRGLPNLSQHLSVMTLGEIRKGVEKLEEGASKEKYRVWLERTLPGRFGDRILPISIGVADAWGRLMASVTRTLPIIDSLIAATALHHDLRLVTRNERDFVGVPGLIVVNPWEL